MSPLLLIRQALEMQLAAIDSFPTVWENEAKEAPASAFQQAYVLPNTPDNSVSSPTLYCERGIFQISLRYPLGSATAGIMARADLIRTQFKRGTTLTQGGVNVLITQTPKVGAGMVDESFWHVPVSIPWQAWVPVA